MGKLDIKANRCLGTEWTKQYIYAEYGIFPSHHPHSEKLYPLNTSSQDCHHCSQFTTTLEGAEEADLF